MIYRHAMVKCGYIISDLLHSITMIGKQGDNAFTPASKLTQEGSIDKNNPVFGLKRDIIRLIGNLVYKNRTNQDKVCYFSEMNDISSE